MVHQLWQVGRKHFSQPREPYEYISYCSQNRSGPFSTLNVREGRSRQNNPIEYLLMMRAGPQVYELLINPGYFTNLTFS